MLNLNKTVVLFSGGTDSTAAAVSIAKTSSEIHLLTFTEYATRLSPIPIKKVELLKEKFQKTRWLHEIFHIDESLKLLIYRHYIKKLLKWGILNLATPGMSSLAWHITTIKYCKKNNIRTVADGLTRELMHFPNHQDWFIRLLQILYRKHGIEYVNPVRDWDTPPVSTYLNKIVIDTALKSERLLGINSNFTTGSFLKQNGLEEYTNIKGFPEDWQSQHDCYPFVVYNLFYFFIAIPIWGEESTQRKLELFFTSMMKEAETLI